MTAFIDERRGDFGVEPVCRVLGVSASAYYQRKTGEPSARAVEDERLLARIRVEHARNWEAYGYRRMWKHLLREGERVPRCQVQRLMREHNIRGAKRRGRPWRTTRPDAAARPLPDLLARDFTADRPNARWVADFTYLRCPEGFVFFAFILDVYSRMLVGWQLATHMRDELVIDALKMAVAARDPDPELELVHHSDRGSQYTSGDFADVLDDHDILASVGSTGDAYDNAMAESFVDTLKTELIADRHRPSRSRLELALVKWIGWYNNQRLHGELGDVPPVEFEFAHQLQALTSADLEERPCGPLLSTAGQAAQTKEVTT